MVRGGGSLVLYLHQVKTSTSTEILQLDEMLNEVRVECDLMEKMATIQELTSLYVITYTVFWTCTCTYV